MATSHCQTIVVRANCRHLITYITHIKYIFVHSRAISLSMYPGVGESSVEVASVSMPLSIVTRSFAYFSARKEGGIDQSMAIVFTLTFMISRLWHYCSILFVVSLASSDILFMGFLFLLFSQSQNRFYRPSRTNHSAISPKSCFMESGSPGSQA